MPDSAQSSHPGVPELAAFAQGKLADFERAVVQRHLNECAACRKQLAALPAGTESKSTRDTQPTIGAAASPPGATATHRPEAAVLADLANHPRYEVVQLLGQ